MPERNPCRYTREELAQAVATSETVAEVLRKLGLIPRGGNYATIRKKMRDWGIDGSRLERSIVRHDRPRMGPFTDDEFADVVASSETIAQVIRHFGGTPSTSNYRRFHRMVELLDLDISHLRGQGWARGKQLGPNGRARPLDEILVAGSWLKTSKLRDRLVREDVLEARCGRCGRTEWEGGPIPLELDHINGDRTDNRLENLRLLCPNCHALTPTYRGRNIGNGTRRS